MQKNYIDVAKHIKKYEDDGEETLAWCDDCKEFTDFFLMEGQSSLAKQTKPQLKVEK